jgi:DNA (cytosine-5)-methyltransferase 1
MEKYFSRGTDLVREIALSDGSSWQTSIQHVSSDADCSLAALYDQAWLRSQSWMPNIGTRGTLRVGDFFSGCGGLSLGIHEAARAVGLSPEIRVALDSNSHALDVFGFNFPEARLVSSPIESIFNGEIGKPFTAEETSFLNDVGSLDLIIGGPPCQGHSALNNHTRHDDARNQLYMRMARVCEVLTPSFVLIENVPGVLKDKTQVAQKTWEVLRGLGYFVESLTVDAASIGVAQRRKRNFTVASRKGPTQVGETLSQIQASERSVRWAIEDLRKAGNKNSTYDSAAKSSKVNELRMQYLFDNDIYDLPDEERPDCHRLKAHSYKSVYGRLHWDRCSQTITTGFGGMGRGRYVHPSDARTLTPHEAARLQFFPDFFDFTDKPRTVLQSLIGNAVPPKLGYAVGLGMLR